MLWIYLLCGALLIAVILLCGKIFVMRSSLKSIIRQLEEKENEETNTLLTISSADRVVKQFARELNRQLIALRRARRRYMRGDMELKNAISNISHDLRTPLTAISGYLELLEKTEMMPDAARYIEIMKSRISVLKKLTSELFQYSVILACADDEKVSPLVVNEVLEECIAGFYTALKEKQITPEISIPEQKVICMGDRVALGRIFSNLMDNAVKYSKGDLEIMLTMEGRVMFANTAPGLTKVNIERIFDRFYTVASGEKSTGLGLSIARILVEQMGGSINAAYDKEKLVISVFLPPSGTNH